MNSLLSRRRGFTLIELLLVIGIIAILASIVIIAINPTKQLGKARNAQRRSDVNTILNAVYQYAIDHNGNLPGTLSGSIIVGEQYFICKVADTPRNTVVADIATDCGGSERTRFQNDALTSDPDIRQEVRLDALQGDYVVSLPVDPQQPATSTGTYYTILKNSGNRITVTAQRAEDGETITVTR